MVIRNPWRCGVTKRLDGSLFFLHTVLCDRLTKLCSVSSVTGKTGILFGWLSKYLINNELFVVGRRCIWIATSWTCLSIGPCWSLSPKLRFVFIELLHYCFCYFELLVLLTWHLSVCENIICKNINLIDAFNTNLAAHWIEKVLSWRIKYSIYNPCCK